ncbi:MAG: hypothetical protein KQI81_06715 [Deltaproteobacteria bacterium]|nr:hypothetical protein [Deltaproteobacteria bacterium]
MEKKITAVEVADNGGRRRIADRRFLVTVPCDRERRTNWDRRSGYDRRLRRIPEYPEDRRVGEETLSD